MSIQLKQFLKNKGLDPQRTLESWLQAKFRPAQYATSANEIEVQVTPLIAGASEFIKIERTEWIKSSPIYYSFYYGLSKNWKDNHLHAVNELEQILGKGNEISYANARHHEWIDGKVKLSVTTYNPNDKDELNKDANMYPELAHMSNIGILNQELNLLSGELSSDDVVEKHSIHVKKTISLREIHDKSLGRVNDLFTATQGELIFFKAKNLKGIIFEKDVIVLPDVTNFVLELDIIIPNRWGGGNFLYMNVNGNRTEIMTGSTEMIKQVANEMTKFFGLKFKYREEPAGH